MRTLVKPTLATLIAILAAGTAHAREFTTEKVKIKIDVVGC